MSDEPEWMESKPAVLGEKEASDVLLEIAKTIAGSDLGTAALFESLSKWIKFLEEVLAEVTSPDGEEDAPDEQAEKPEESKHGE
jgi:hypothetical protein